MISSAPTPKVAASQTATRVFPPQLTQILAHPGQGRLLRSVRALVEPVQLLVPHPAAHFVDLQNQELHLLNHPSGVDLLALNPVPVLELERLLDVALVVLQQVQVLRDGLVELLDGNFRQFEGNLLLAAGLHGARWKFVVDFWTFSLLSEASSIDRFLILLFVLQTADQCSLKFLQKGHLDLSPLEINSLCRIIMLFALHYNYWLLLNFKTHYFVLNFNFFSQSNEVSFFSSLFDVDFQITTTKTAAALKS